MVSNTFWNKETSSSVFEIPVGWVASGRADLAVFGKGMSNHWKKNQLGSKMLTEAPGGFLLHWYFMMIIVFFLNSIFLKLNSRILMTKPIANYTYRWYN